jgi:hypothetical protein
VDIDAIRKKYFNDEKGLLPKHSHKPPPRPGRPFNFG